MRYQGGKTKLAKGISEAILSLTNGRGVYVEPFLGGGSVAAKMVPHFADSRLSDSQEDLMMLWQALSEGWTPPATLSEAEYQSLKTAEPSALRGFAAFATFGGKFFGGYPRSNDSRDYYAEANRGTAKKVKEMAGAEFSLADYRSLVIPEGAVVYCDPPYQDTLGYKAVGGFDSEEFFEVARGWARIPGVKVFVSEFDAPNDFMEVWSRERTIAISREDKQRKIDKLFLVSATPENKEEEMTARIENLPNARAMKTAMFTQHVDGYWNFCKSVGTRTTFNLTIKKETGEYRHDVMNEDFGQPEYYGDMFPVYCNQIVANIDVILHELRLQGIAIEFDHAEYRTRPHRTRPHRIRPGTGQSISVGQVFSLERWEPGGGFVHAPA